ncbi:TPA: hypothetical protein HA244_01775 [Candidatus Micrarchaeota archaeon]|nr:hypothetical protein [Candidatus Micrarchaeota archaeon]
MALNKVFSNRRIQVLSIVFLIALGMLFLRDLNPLTFDANLGIEFVGGVRIPISLERSVDSQTMGLMVDTIKMRINKFGLSQAVVRPLGDKDILVEIPRADSRVINSIEDILREQGKFEAVVDGRQALAGEHIIANAIGGPQGEQVQQSGSGIEWILSFAITGDGEMFFADAAQGKSGFPVLMFLDRPEKAVVVLPNESILANVPQDSIDEVLKKSGDDLSIVVLKNGLFNESVLQGKERVVVGDQTLKANPRLQAFLADNGFSNATDAEKRLVSRPEADFTPVSLPSQTGISISSWPAIGLRSAPTLQVEPIRQNVITQYQISGLAKSGATIEEQEQNAKNEIKELKSILSGGRLPVTTIVGSYYDVSPSLGRQFMAYSIIGLFLATLAVSILLVLRYRKLRLIIPIVLTLLIEIVILLSLLGTFGTLDLGAMAGIVALIGSGVDNQIIITDEFMRKGKQDEDVKSNAEKFKSAFFIVFTTAGIAIASMMPLFLSGIVEVMGFALSSILGVLIGIAVTRPAYGVLMEEIFSE